jgi:hypothetical protein
MIGFEPVVRIVKQVGSQNANKMWGISREMEHSQTNRTHVS